MLLAHDTSDMISRTSFDLSCYLIISFTFDNFSQEYLLLLFESDNIFAELHSQ
jgi:hypothetical protein